jgi:hypothetical protein
MSSAVFPRARRSLFSAALADLTDRRILGRTWWRPTARLDRASAAPGNGR